MQKALFTALLVACGWPAAGWAASPATVAAEPLTNVQRVVFLGDSITFSGQYINFVEAWFAVHFPGRTIEFLNLGLPSETVSGLSEVGHAEGKFPRPDLHDRLSRVLAETQPDLVIACYGMNCGIYLPFEASRFAKYRAGLEWLRDQCATAGAQIIHLTPPVYDEVKGGKPGYRETLRRYSEWLLQQRMQGWRVVDIQTAMSTVLDKGREANPQFVLASDGVHPGELGHWIMARELLVSLGAPDLQDCAEPGAFTKSLLRGEQLLKLISQCQTLLRDAWLTETRHTRPGLNPGVPLPEAQKRAAELQRKIQELTTNR